MKNKYMSNRKIIACSNFPAVTSIKRLMIIISTGIATLLPGSDGVSLAGAGYGAVTASYFVGNPAKDYDTNYHPTITPDIIAKEQDNFRRKEKPLGDLKKVIESYNNDDESPPSEIIDSNPGVAQLGIQPGYLEGGNIKISEQLRANIANEPSRFIPLTWQAEFSEKKLKKSETAPTNSEVLYDYPTLAMMSDSVASSSKSHTIDTQETKKQQVTFAESQTDSKIKIFNYYPESLLTIHSGSYGALGDAVCFLDSSPSASVVIHAYTDFSDDPDRNLALTQKRVSDIRNYLILHGISMNKITAHIQEKNNVLEGNHAEQLRSLNNLVEITIR